VRRWRLDGRPGALAVALATTIGVALLLSQEWLCRTNTLLRNGGYSSAKVGLARGVMGAVSFLTTTTALSRGRLDLGAWHGFQQVELKDSQGLAEAAFDFQLDPGGYLGVIHHRDEHGNASLRFSADPRLPPIAVLSDEEGAFLSTTPLPGGQLDSNWHHLRVAWADHRADAYLDGVALPAHLVPASQRPAVGFWGGFRSARVDNLEVRRSDGSVLIDRFDNRRGRAKAIAASLVLALAFSTVLLVLRGPKVAISGNLVLGATLLLVWGFDFFYFSGRHPTHFVDFAGFENTIESRDQALARLRRVGSQAPVRPRLLFIGTSQAWGAGARRPSETWVARACRALGGGERYECVNAGISGETAPGLVELYRSEWLALGPALVVVDLGNNDSNEGAFESSLESLATLNEERKIPTLFVPEPNSTEIGQAALERKHALLRAVARRHGFPVVEMPRALAERASSGRLWWDFAHLSSYGQRLFAEVLVPEMRKLLRVDEPSHGQTPRGGSNAEDGPRSAPPAAPTAPKTG